MNASSSPHPDRKDLENLARERLGKKKSQRILDHCKECPECADALLDHVRTLPIEREKLRLSKWNWVSLILLVVSLAVVVLAMIWLLRGTSRSVDPGLTGAVPTEAAETVHAEQPHTWFEDAFTHAMVSPDGSRLLRVDGFGVRLLGLPGGRDLTAELLLDFDNVMAATFDGNGRIARFANLRRDMGWFVEGAEGLRSTALPLDAVPSWAPENRDVAWIRSSTSRVVLGEPPDRRSYDVGDRVLGLAWSPIGDAAYVLTMAESGVATLLRIRPLGGEVEIVRAGLDASALPNGIAVSADGGSVFVALAGAAPPDPEARHSSDVDRDLDIYAVDVASGELRVVVDAPGDDFWPWVAGGWLYWTHNDYRADVVTLAIDESGAAPTATLVGRLEIDSQLPRWHPGGERLAFTAGARRLADWGLNLDGGVARVGADGDIRPEGVLVRGYHADYSPAWSPDGRWLAFRSRRSPRPVPYYAGPEVADDIFLLRDGAPGATEIRLTDFGREVGGPSWSVDGDRLLFDTWERLPQISRPFVATIDPADGGLVGIEPLALPDGVSGSVAAVYSPVSDDVLLIERLSPRRQALWRVTPAGEAEKLVEFESATRSGAGWTPDGRHAVYSAMAGGALQLFRVPSAGGEPVQLTAGEVDLLHPQVSPDGRWIAATRLQQRKEIRRLLLR